MFALILALMGQGEGRNRSQSHSRVTEAESRTRPPSFEDLSSLGQPRQESRGSPSEAGMTHQPTLTVLCGLPGSGKSHWATEHAGSAVVLTGDSIRTGADPGRTFDGMRAECSRLLALGRDVLIDACSLTRRSRLEWLGIASTTRAQANLVLIDTHEDECASRNRTRHDRARVDWAKLRKQWAETTVAVHGEPWASIRVVRG